MLAHRAPGWPSKAETFHRPDRRPIVGGVAGHVPDFSASEYVIGIDVGTTAAKVSGFGLNRGWRHSASREYPLDQPRPGWAVQDPDRVWGAVREALREVVDESGPRRAVCVCLSSAMHGLIGLDGSLRPRTPLLTWADSRAGEVARELRATPDGAALHRTSGTPVHPMSPLTKLIWYHRFDPDTADEVRRWVGLKDWIVLQLTGELVAELSSASGSGLLDLQARDWNPAALDLAGIVRGQLPPVVPTTTQLPLAAAPAGAVGLPPGLPVVVGAGDGPLGNLGVRALSPGVAGLSLGTSGAVRMVVDRPGIDPGMTLFCYALTDDVWVNGGAVSNGGVVVRWLGEMFGAGLKLAPGESVDAALLDLASGVGIGAEGLLMLPYLLAERAPLWDPEIPGAFLGVARVHTPAHFARAAAEGVAQQLATIVAALDLRTPVTQVRATGGVFRSTLWRDLVAAAIGRPLAVTAGADGTALGAAALGLYALGRAESLRLALDQLDQVGSADAEPYVAPPADVAAYARLRAQIPARLAIYDQVAALYRPEPGSRSADQKGG